MLCLAAIRIRPSSKEDTSIFHCSLCIAMVSLMMDQVCKYMTKGLAMQFVGEAQGDLSDISRVLEGEYLTGADSEGGLR